MVKIIRKVGVIVLLVILILSIQEIVSSFSPKIIGSMAATDVPNAVTIDGSDELAEHNYCDAEQLDEEQPNVEQANTEQSKEDLSQEEKQEEKTEVILPETPQEEQQEESKAKVAYLTFDDGPTAYTGPILDILAEYGAKATFFMLEPQMEGNYEVLQRMINEGHALGLHGVTHDRKQFYQSAERVLGEMNMAQAKLAELTGYKSFLIRTPYGSKPHMKPDYMEAVEMNGYKIWDWNVDSRDWLYRDERMVDETINQISTLEQYDIQPVILFHDRKDTVDYLPQVLEYLLSNGFSLKTLALELKPVLLK